MIDQSKLNKDFKFKEILLKEQVDISTPITAQIYDNFLPLNIFIPLKNLLLSQGFPWYYKTDIIHPKMRVPSPINGYDNNDKGYQFTHMFLRHGNNEWSSTQNLISPFLNIVNPKKWIRVKANLNAREDKPLVHGWHYDLYRDDGVTPYADSITGVFHINTNNGCTFLETGHKIESIQNRLVLFPCNILHTGIRQTDTKIRVLLNCNFY